MSTSRDPLRSFPHNTIWLRLRRRWLIDRFTMFGVALTCPPMFCGVMWLLHGPVWLIICTGTLWVLSNLFVAATIALGLVFKASRSRQGARSGSVRVALLWQLFVTLATVIALLFGRVEWAVYASFGLASLGGLMNVRALSWRSAAQMALAIALCIAFAAHAAWAAVCLLLLQYLPFRRLRPDLRQAIRLLPTRVEYVARSREACSAGAG